jgi:hypothetical protein
MTGLTEIDSLEILVIVDNEVDPMSTYSNPAIQATGNIVHIGMRPRSSGWTASAAELMGCR